MPPYEFNLSPEVQALLRKIAEQEAQQELQAQSQPSIAGTQGAPAIQGDQPLQQTVPQYGQVQQAVPQYGQVTQQGGAPQPQPAQIANVGNAPTQAPSQDKPLDAKQMIDQAVLSMGQSEADPLRTQLLGKIINEKRKYETAPEGTEGDKIRKAANLQATAYRDLFKRMGYDLTGYGEDNSLAEASALLNTERAKNIVDAFQKGAYRKPAEDYYSEQYKDLIRDGLSPRRASKVAGRLAQSYQSERAASLDSLFNSNGLDGLVITPEGNQILAKLAKEDPELANFYLQIYPNAREAYKRANDVEDAYRNHKFGFEIRDDIFNKHEKSADNAHARQKDILAIMHQYGIEDKQLANALAVQAYGAQKAVDYDYYTKQSAVDYDYYNKKAATDYDYYTKKVPFMTQLEAAKHQNTGNVPKLSEKQQERVNSIANLYLKARDTLTDDDIGAFRDELNETGRYLNPDTYAQFNKWLRLLEEQQQRARQEQATKPAHTGAIPNPGSLFSIPSIGYAIPALGLTNSITKKLSDALFGG